MLSKARDIPITSGFVIWARQLQNKLKKYMQKIEQILGPNWADDSEGKILKEIGDTFEKKLDVSKVI